MSQTIKLKRNKTNSATTPSTLLEGEIAVNILDKSLFVGDGSNVVRLYIDSDKYFNSEGYANNALKLGGNEVSYFGTAAQVTAINKSINSINANFDNYLSKISGGEVEGDVLIKAALKMNTLYLPNSNNTPSDYQMSVGSLGSGADTPSSGGGGIGKVSIYLGAGTTPYDSDAEGKVVLPPYPTAVTESTVSGWGFTKNTGTYSKPSTGIPKSDLASAVQTLLGKADTALQEHQDLSGYQTKITSINKLAYGLISGTPTSLPASDVYSWAKKSSLAASDVPDLSGTYMQINDGGIPMSTTNNLNRVGYGYVDGGWLYSGPAIAFGSANGYTALLQQKAGDYELRVSYKNNGVASGTWKTVAFTDSNVASATKATQDGDGNTISSTYLKKSGGTISGTLTMSAYGGTYSYDIAFYSPNKSGSLGIKGDLLKWTFDGVENTLIHSGNIGSQRVNYANSSDVCRRADYIQTRTPNGGYYGDQYMLYGMWNANNTSVLDWKVDNYEVMVSRAQKLSNSKCQVAAIVSDEGNVLIGTTDTNGGYKLYVNGDVRISGLNFHHANEINGYNDSSQTIPSNVHINYRSSGNVTLANGGGNVGIGTTTPLTKLDVDGGNARITSYGTLFRDADKPNGYNPTYMSEIYQWQDTLFFTRNNPTTGAFLKSVAYIGLKTGNFTATGNISASGYQLPTSAPSNPVSGGYYLYVGSLGTGATIS